MCGPTAAAARFGQIRLVCSAIGYHQRMNELLRIARHALGSGAHHLGLSQHDIDRLLEPQRTLELSLPVTIQGKPRTVRAWRVQHNLARGPGKGGVRYASSVNVEEVTGLATIMSLKNSLAGLPFGGAKGGIAVDAGTLDDDDRIELARVFAEGLGLFIGPHTDILGPDVGTGSVDMDAVTHAWSAQQGVENAAIATGKSMDAGGIELRAGATARGCLEAARVARDQLDLSTDARVAIQGFGAVGRELALLLADDGHPIVAVSDSSGGVFADDGLDVQALAEQKEDGVSLADADSDADRIGSLDVLTCDTDIVVPAALQGVVDADIADNLKASVVLEAANAPASLDGIRRLAHLDVTVVPDLAVNSGGVVGSFHEWRTNTGKSSDDESSAEQAREDLISRVKEANENMWDRAESDSVDLRTAAVSLALEKILDAENSD